MDAEIALLIEIHRRRRQLADELLGALNDAIAQQQPKRTRTVRAVGKREVGLALFQATRKKET